MFGAKCKDLKPEILEEMWAIRSKDFERCNISDNHSIYRICEDSYKAAISHKSLVNDEHSHSALRKMAGVGLFVKQQQRDNGKAGYNNPAELLALIEDSSALKSIHPDLFEQYKFNENIGAIMRLQLGNELSPEMISQINTAYNGLSSQEKTQDVPKTGKGQDEIIMNN